ncbi:ATP-binding protein [Pseudoalteromonas sp. T1lg65]|uniref:PAS domain-containing hybrid sensor histidine kinase/response regulator n=1 Tax=Pseudoalteromonas sp. T1lg65 TaxID=2077101 RepID=UPI003F79C68D
MDATKQFLPLKSYKKGVLIAVVIPILVVLVLGYHMYQLKLERQYKLRLEQYHYLTEQLDQETNTAKAVINSITVSLQRPLPLQEEPQWLDSIQQHQNYYYRLLPNNSGEIIGRGQFVSDADATSQWQRALSLDSTFDAALALQGALYAIAYVKDDGFAYVKRRDTSSSQFLTYLSAGRFNPDFSRGSPAVSQLVELEDRRLFAFGNRASTVTDAHIIMVYDSDAVGNWLKNIGSLEGSIEVINQSGELIVGESALFKGLQVNARDNPPWQDDLLFLSQQPKALMQLNYFESYQRFSTPLQNEVVLEVCFLIFFILLTFIAIVWLSSQIFIKPLTHFVNFLSLQDGAPSSTQNYSIPEEWQPWFAQVKQVVEQKEQLMSVLQQHNQALDDEVKRKQYALTQSLAVKEQQAALLNAVLDAVPDMIYFKDSSGVFTGCNRAFEKFVGISKSTLISGDAVPDVSKFAIFLEQEAVMKEAHQAVTCNFSFAETHFVFTVSPLMSETGVLIGYLGVIRDITSQQQAYKAISDSEEHFRAAIEYAPNGVILAGVDGDVLEMNKTARRFLGESATVQSKHLQNFFEESSWKVLKSILAELLKENKKVVEHTISQSGKYQWLQLNVSLVWDKNRQPQYYVIHLQNITGLLLAKQDAERATLAKSRFIANISHEIRTPINAILGLAEMIAGEALTPNQTKQLHQLSNAANELLVMLNSILEFAKVESHQASIQFETLQTSQTIEAVASLIRPLCTQKRLGFEIDVDVNLWPYLYTDEDKLKQILVNLLSNAVKYTIEGKIGLNVKVQSEEATKQQVRFEVWDTGIGIKQQDVEHLFDAFTQGDESFARRHEGIGLGLAIVKQEVELLGGNVAVDSTPKQGSCFYFELVLDKGACSILDGNKKMFVLCDKPHYLPSYFNNSIVPVSSETLKDTIEGSDSALLIVPPKTIKQSVLDDIDLARALLLMSENDGLSFANSVELNSDAFFQAVYAWISERGHTSYSLEKQTIEISGILCLVVDDNTVNLEITANMLMQSGISVSVLDSAEHIVEICTALRPDVVLMDIHMPQVDGFAATKQLREKFSQQELPIIALTANTHKEEREQAGLVGMNDYLIKPIRTEKACRSIANNLTSKVTDEQCFFDYEFALAQMMHNEAFLDTMLNKFAKLCSDYIEQLQQTTDASKMLNLAHGIKGSAAGLGFKRLATNARLLEAHCKQVSIITNTALQQELRKSLEQVITYIRLKKLSIEHA